MLLPKGTVIHEDLYTQFINLNEFIDNLTNEVFTGFIKIEFWEYTGLLFMDSGSIINAIEEIKGDNSKLNSAKPAYLNLMVKCKQKDGKISVHAISSELMILLSAIPSRHPLLEDLSTDYVKLDKLITKLTNEEQWGYIDVNTNDKKLHGIIFFGEGTVQSSLCEQARVNDVISGNEAFEAIMQRAETVGAAFNVFTINPEAAYMETGGVTSPDKIISPEIWDVLISELTRHLGPMAAMILEDGVESLGEKYESFPKSRMNKLLDYVADEMGVPEKAEEFRKFALAQLK